MRLKYYYYTLNRLWEINRLRNLKPLIRLLCKCSFEQNQVRKSLGFAYVRTTTINSLG